MLSGPTTRTPTATLLVPQNAECFECLCDKRIAQNQVNVERLLASGETKGSVEHIFSVDVKSCAPKDLQAMTSFQHNPKSVPELLHESSHLLAKVQNVSSDSIDVWHHLPSDKADEAVSHMGRQAPHDISVRIPGGAITLRL